MLMKLFRHEWSYFWKLPTVLCVVAFAYTIVGSLTFHTSLWDSDNNMAILLCVLGSIAYFLILLAPTFVLFVFSGYRFYKNLYMDEGYLMHTLPVRKSQLLFSKAFVAMIWTVIVTLVTLFNLAVLVCMIATSARYGALSAGEMFQAIGTGLGEMAEALSMIMNMPFVVALFLFILVFIIESAFNILMIYVSVSVGQLWKKHPVAGSILTFFMAYFGLQFVAITMNGKTIATYTEALDHLAVESEIEAYEILRQYILGVIGKGVLLSVLGGIVFFAIIYYVMSRKLNLD